MKTFPNKIFLDQENGSKKILPYWYIKDLTNCKNTNIISKEYVQLDKVIEWIKIHFNFQDEQWHTDTENYKSTLETVIEDLKKSFENI